MTAHEFRSWLQTLVEAQATIPAAEVLRRLPDGATQPHEAGGDMTLKEVADEVGRAKSTVRSWCNSEKLEGAYRLNNRDWRVPRRSLQAFLAGQSTKEFHNEVQIGETSWDDWRSAS